MNAVKPAKSSRSRSSPRLASSKVAQDEDKMTPKQFLKEVHRLLSQYPRDSNDLCWEVETPYGPVLVGDAEAPSRKGGLYYIPIRFWGTREQFLEFWGRFGRFERCDLNGKWNILEKDPHQALWLLRKRFRGLQPHLPLPFEVTVIHVKSQSEKPRRKPRPVPATASYPSPANASNTSSRSTAKLAALA